MTTSERTHGGLRLQRPSRIAARLGTGVLVGVAAVVVGTHWPTIGATAGVVVLLVTVFAVTQRISWTTGTTQWWSPTDAVGYAAVSAYPAIVGAVLVAASVVRGRSRARTTDR